jgi:hypothetical protein
MANRFWVGGTANWDGTAGTKWATTSGGAGGSAVPTSVDDVFFDAASGAVTCTLTATGQCKSINFTGFTGTFAGTNSLIVAGSVTFVSGMILTHSGQLEITATGTLTTGGKTILATILSNSTGGVVTLGDALTCSTSITVFNGTFTTNNFNVTATILSSSTTNTRAINLGSSTVTLSAAAAVAFATNTNLTFNAGTSTITCSATSVTIAGGAASATGVSFYNVSLTTTAVSTHNIQSINTFNNLTVTAPASAGFTQVTFDSRQTISGALSTTGTAGNRRVWFRGVTYGVAQTLTINSAPSLTDADFRDIYVIGTAAPISGTRIGNLRGCSGITFSTAKIVYWNLAGTNAWNADAWATTSAGTPSTDNYPLAQDTATFTNAGAITQVNVFPSSDYVGTVDMSSRTSAMTIQIQNAGTVYGDWKNGSGTTITNAVAITFSGRNTQTITSAGKTFSGPITVDSYGGSVELADALNIGSNSLTVTNGTFDTKNYNVTAGTLSSDNSNVRTITLGSSTVTLSSQLTLTTSTNLTFNAGTSSIVLSASSPTFNGGSQTFYSVSFTSTSTAAGVAINGANTFQNLSFSAPATAGRSRPNFSANQTITGTLTCAGASAVRRIILISDTVGTPRTLTVATLSADDCDFRDITIAGAAAGSSPTRAGNCGGNTGITFPVAKTVYWNLAGTQNWSATAWATSSGGTPAVNNFPLAQDTAVYDNTGSVTGTITIDAGWNIGTFDASARTSAMTLTTSSNTPTVYGNWLFGTGITQTSSTGTITFAGQVTQTITSNGVTFGCPITFDCGAGTVQLADALTLDSARRLTLTSGAFDAVTYNVTSGLFTGGGTATLKMGSGTWTLSGIGTVWNMGSAGASFNLYKGTANIVLSDTTTGAKTFDGSGFSFGKLTIGGATGISTLTINGSNQFTELASTKTVAHTIALGTTTQTFGAWTVTGTVGNMVTVTGTGVSHVIAGARVSGVDYLAMGTIGFIATSPGEFYAGANSTGSNATILKTAAPSATTRYWVGGTGTWDATTTTNWSTSSGGASGASVPTSADAVIFDSASNTTGYTVTCTATQLRCAALTFAGPATGSVTWAGTAPLAIHGNFTLPTTNLTRSYTGSITFSGSSTGRTITTNGVALASATTVNGVGCGWTLASALDIGSSSVTVTNGSFATSSYSLTTGLISSSNSNARTINFGSSTITVSGSFLLGTTENARANLTFTAGTSQINLSGTNPTLDFNNQTFYNVSATSVTLNVPTITGVNTFNNLSFAGRTSAGIANISVSGNQTISGTLTLSAGTDATMRNFVQSDTIGTTRTLTCAAFAGTDADFRDITIAGAAAPASGTRLGDCKGNSGITFGAGTTKYWNLAAGGNWSATGWATSSGGTPAINNFPLAQDTCLFEATGLTSGNTVTINAAYNIGTVNMAARTSNTMTLAIGSTLPFIYGNWINGTGTTTSGAGPITFAGRGSQEITSASRTFTFTLTIDSPSGLVTLQDALNTSRSIGLTSGTFNTNNYNVTDGLGFSSVNSNTRTLALGSGTWTSAGVGAVAWTTSTSTNLTVTGTGTISLTSASAKTFNGGGASFSGITLNQGGAGTLTITGNSTLANISNTYKATGATTINFDATTQRVGSFTASGEVGRVLTVKGASASSPCTLIYTGVGQATSATTDYLTITGVRAYSLETTWYAGVNSTNNGSLGWFFTGPPVPGIYYGSTNVTTIYYGSTPVSAIYYGAYQVF